MGSRLVLFALVLASGCGGSGGPGTCEYTFDEGTRDNSIPAGLQPCVERWVADKCTESALSSATLGLKTSGYTFTAGATCASRGFKECRGFAGTYYKVCPEELAMQTPVAKAPEAPRPVEPPRKPEPTSLAAPLEVPADAPFLGAADAKVVLHLFGDYQDPFTARLWPTLSEAIKRHPELKIVFRHNPVPFHTHAPLAHQAALEAYKQKGNDGFWAMHARIVNDPRNLDRATLVAYAKPLGLDVGAFEKALDEGTHAARVDQDVKVATDLGIRSTPISIIDTRIARGQLPADRFEAFITGKP
ncbi:MAG TPA: DsbA family protein [Kofleriaceae bacterium]|nr:DsbA family protein [Kofleriaceae bacterium]